MVIIILVGAACFSSIFMGSGGGEVVKDFIFGIGLGKWGTFFVMMVILFFLGMFIDWIGIIMITFISIVFVSNLNRNISPGEGNAIIDLKLTMPKNIIRRLHRVNTWKNL